MPQRPPNPVVLLGAGASVEAGVPATFAMTRMLVKGVGNRQPLSQTAQALNFVCGALVAHDTAEGASPYDGLDVERVFAAVELLATRRTLEVTPFVASWHPAVDGLDRAGVPPFFDRNFRKAIREDRGVGTPSRLLRQMINAVSGVGSGRTYGRLAEVMISELRRLVKTDPERLDYLRPLVAAARRHTGLTVATLNYDLAIEQVGPRERVRVHTGIEHWTTERRWEWPDRGVRLLKLHGSIDWSWEHAERPGHLPHMYVTPSSEPEDDQRRPAVVFGNRGKLRAEGPFLSLLAEFETMLAESNRLVVVGYSFRDEHVNEIVRAWTTESIDRTIVIVDPSLSNRKPRRDDFLTMVLHHLNPGSHRQDIDLPNRVELMDMTAGEAFPQLFG